MFARRWVRVAAATTALVVSPACSGCHSIPIGTPFGYGLRVENRCDRGVVGFVSADAALTNGGLFEGLPRTQTAILPARESFVPDGVLVLAERLPNGDPLFDDELSPGVRGMVSVVPLRGVVMRANDDPDERISTIGRFVLTPEICDSLPPVPDHSPTSNTSKSGGAPGGRSGSSAVRARLE